MRNYMTIVRALLEGAGSSPNHPLFRARLSEEGSVDDVELVAAKKMCADIMAGNSPTAIDMFRDQRRGDEYEDGEDDEDETLDEKEVLYWCAFRISEAAWMIRSHIKGGVIRCWRVITAPVDWNPTGQHPGIYWSWDRDAAEAHWGWSGESNDGVVEWEITADIPVSSIDMEMTLMMNAHPDYEEEREVRIFKDAVVKIINIEVKNAAV